MTKNTLEQNRKISFLIYKFYHFFFSEKFNKKIDYKFDNSKTRLDLINYLIKKKKYKNYLEIGCNLDEIFSKIPIEKIGVDPVRGGNYRGTSDEFFFINKSKFDCIFIDGLHEYDQVLKDINNSLKVLSDDGVIILHDCLPAKASHQFVPRSRYLWNGDVWKAVVEARTWEHVNTFTVLIDHGVAIIKKEKNQDLLKFKCKSFKKLTFNFFYNNYENLMRTISYENFLINN